MSRPHRVPYMDMSARFGTCQADVEQAILSVIRSGHFIGGEWRKRCENEIARLVGLPHAIGVSSGTSALKLALQALGIGPGDEVILPAVSFVATYESIAQTGATPIIVDVQSECPLISNIAIEAAITPRTKAIVPVHLFGMFAAVDDFGLMVVDDAAQALGACPITHGQMATLSFYPTKIIGGVGDGGMVLCQSKAHAENVRALGHHGFCDGLQGGRIHDHMPGNDRLDAIQAAAIVAQLPDLPRRIFRRKEIAKMYDSVIGEWVLPRDLDGNHSVYAFCHPARDQLRASLAEHNIGTAIYYDTPLSKHALVLQSEHCPEAEIFCQQALSLPCHVGLTDDDVGYVCEVLAKVIQCV